MVQSVACDILKQSRVTIRAKLRSSITAAFLLAIACDHASLSTESWKI